MKDKTNQLRHSCSPAHTAAPVTSRGTAILPRPFCGSAELGSHDIANADGTLAQDLSSQSAAMEQAFDCRLSRKLLQVIAGLKTAAAEILDLATKECASGQVIRGLVQRG